MPSLGAKQVNSRKILEISHCAILILQHWIIFLVYWADYYLQKISNCAAWTGQSAIGQPKKQKQTFFKVKKQPNKKGEQSNVLYC